MPADIRLRKHAGLSLWPWLAGLAVITLAALLLSSQGRSWWCACGQFFLWTSDAWSRHTSQHFLDPYSFTHLLHGFAFCGLLAWCAPRVPPRWRLVLVVALEALWEVVENSEFVIRRYRETTAALGYTGDTIANSLGDIMCCGLGFLIARRLGLRRALAAFVLTEALLLLWIRDSLLLEVLMLLYPVAAIKAWQVGVIVDLPAGLT